MGDFSFKNFDLNDSASLAEILKPALNSVLAPPGIGGLGVVPGMGQVPGLEVQMPMSMASQKTADVMDNYDKGTMMDKMGGIPGMATILGMEALKQLGGGGRQQPQQLSSPAPVAPRGQQVRTSTPSNANPIDPRFFLMLRGLGGR